MVYGVDSVDVLIKCDLFLIITDIIWPQRNSLTLPLHSQMNTHWFTRSGQIISLMFESRCSHLKFRYFTCPNQEVPRLISSYSLYISSKKTSYLEWWFLQLSDVAEINVGEKSVKMFSYVFEILSLCLVFYSMHQSLSFSTASTYFHSC